MIFLFSKLLVLQKALMNVYLLTNLTSKWQVTHLCGAHFCLGLTFTPKYKWCAFFIKGVSSCLWGFNVKSPQIKWNECEPVKHFLDIVKLIYLKKNVHHNNIFLVQELSDWNERSKAYA